MSVTNALAGVPLKAARWSAEHPWRAIGAWAVLEVHRGEPKCAGMLATGVLAPAAPQPVRRSPERMRSTSSRVDRFVNGGHSATVAPRWLKTK